MEREGVESDGVGSKEGHKQFGRRDVVRDVVRKNEDSGNTFVLSRTKYLAGAFAGQLYVLWVCLVGVSCDSVPCALLSPPNTVSIS